MIGNSLRRQKTTAAVFRKRIEETYEGKFYIFQDFVDDGKTDEAIQFFNNPGVKMEDSECSQKQEIEEDGEGLGDLSDKLEDSLHNVRHEPRDYVATSSAKRFIKKDPLYKSLIANSETLKMEDQSLVLLRYWIMMKTNDDEQNVLHTACKNGNLKLLQFLLGKAGPAYLNILPHIINKQDHLGMTPLYLLCSHGSQITETDCKLELEHRKDMLKLLIEGDEDVRDIEDENRRQQYTA